MLGKALYLTAWQASRLAVVDDVPGTTRDRLVMEAEWAGSIYDIVDTGGIDPTQTGPGRNQQPLSIGSADFIEQIRAQAEIAIQGSDAVLFITDAESGVTPADHEVARILRKYRRNVDGQAGLPCFWW